MLIKSLLSEFVRMFLLLAIAAGCAEPFDKSAAIRKAERATQAKKFEKAIALLNEVIEHDSLDVEARFRLGLALALDNQPLQARLELRQVIDLDSTRADALEHLGMLAFGAEDRPEAIEMLEWAVRMGAQKIHLYDTLSYLHFQQGTIEEGKKWIRRAIQANPRDPRFRVKLATLDHFIGSFEDAKRTLEQLVAAYPQYWDAKLLLGQVYRQLGENDKALEMLNEALANTQGHEDHLQELGMAKLKTGDTDGAIEAFEKVILRNPETSEAHYGIGQAYMKAGEREKAKNALEIFREMQQNDKSLKNKQAKFISNWQDGLVKEREEDFEAAVASFEEALDHKTGDVGTHLLIWLAHRNQGQSTEASRAYRTLQRLIRVQGREFKEISFTLSGRLAQKGFDDKAAEVLHELLKRHPKHEAGRYRLIQVYNRLGLNAERDAQFAIFRSGDFPAPGPLEDDSLFEAQSGATSFEAGYIGAEACAECHKDRYETFRETAHHLTSAKASSGSILGSFEPGKNQVVTSNESLTFEMTQEGDTYYQTAYITNEDGVEGAQKERFDFSLGSGKLGQTYVYWDSNRLHQLPISYLSATDKWINSPGYEDGKANFSRPIAPRCLECHATYFEVDAYTTNVYKRDEHILGISCERCHGPGSKHYENQKYGSEEETEGSPYILVPSQLSSELSIEICAQCHSGSSVEAMGKPFSHRPGRDLAKSYKLTDFERYGSTHRSHSNLGVHSANQIARLTESECFRKSEEMTCVDCHNPHVKERGQLKVFSERCMKCHENVEVCGMSDHIGSEIVDNCIDCHVPQKHDLNMGFDTAQGFQFQEMRDHNIGIYHEVSARVAERMGKPLNAQ